MHPYKWFKSHEIIMNLFLCVFFQNVFYFCCSPLAYFPLSWLFSCSTNCVDAVWPNCIYILRLYSTLVLKQKRPFACKSKAAFTPHRVLQKCSFFQLVLSQAHLFSLLFSLELQPQLASKKKGRLLQQRSWDRLNFWLSQSATRCHSQSHLLAI